MYYGHMLKEYDVLYRLISNWRIFVLLIYVYLKMYSTTIFYINFWVGLSTKDFSCLEHSKLLSSRNASISQTIDRALFNGRRSFLYFWVRIFHMCGWPMAGHVEREFNAYYVSPDREFRKTQKFEFKHNFSRAFEWHCSF